MHKVVIVGGGFGGLQAARKLKRAPVSVTLLDRQNYHLFQPLLYQVATGSLSPANIASPLRGVLCRQPNVRVLLAEVTDIDLAVRQVITSDGPIGYDTLVLATGSQASYFGHTGWEEFAPGLKTIDDATLIRRKILLAFETAERETVDQQRRAWLTFVLVGGGPTGVELAGAIAELARHTLRRNFRAFDPATARVLLIEAGERILPTYPHELAEKAIAALMKLGVTVWTGGKVSQITPNAVTVQFQDRQEHVFAQNVFWTAGVQASPFSKTLATQAGVALDRGGRVIVEPDFTVPGHTEVFVIGDLAHYQHGDLRAPLPGIAPVAVQAATFVARTMTARLAGRAAPTFRYRHRGDMATIGRGEAVADINGWRFDGYLAWLAWLFVHLLNIVHFQNRLLVLMQWAYSYVTRNRAARLITGPSPFPLTGPHSLAADSTTSEPPRDVASGAPAPNLGTPVPGSAAG